MSRFARVRGARLGRAALIALVLVGAGADLLAADLPLAVRVDGHLYILPCVRRPPALRDDDQQSLAARASWMLRTPVPFGPLASRPGGQQSALEPPSLRHLLGTDDRGRDVAARTIHGARTALRIAPLAVALYLALGLVIGVACALGRRIDAALSRLIEVGLTFPTLLLLLAVQGAVGAPSTTEVALAIALTRWPDVARLCRAAALSAAASPSLEAARALGASPLRIAGRHLLPHALSPALTAAALGIGQAVLLEAALAYLGFGAPPPTPSWGELLAEAHGAGLPWWLIAAPTGALAITVLAASRVAEGLRATR